MDDCFHRLSEVPLVVQKDVVCVRLAHVSRAVSGELQTRLGPGTLGQVVLHTICPHQHLQCTAGDAFTEHGVIGKFFF